MRPVGQFAQCSGTCQAVAWGVARVVVACLALALVLPAPAGAAPSPAEQRQIEAKIRALRADLQKDPDNPELVFQLARQLSLLERTAEAARQYARIVAVYPDNAEYLLGQGQNWLWGKQPERAIAPLQRALRLAPAYQDVHRALGQALVAAGRTAQARTLFAQALQRFNRPLWAQQALAALEGPASTAASGVAPAVPGAAAERRTTDGVSAAAVPSAATAPALAAPASPPPLVAAAPVPAQPAPALPPLMRSIEAGYGSETLSNGTPAWSDRYLEFHQRYEGRRGWVARATDASRFGLSDTALLLSAYMPVAAATAIAVEAMVSPTHQVLAQHTLHTQLSRSLPNGWGVQAGWKRLKYNTASIDALDFTVERYFGPFRAAWSIHPSRSSTAGDAVGQRLQFGYFYRDSSSIQVLVAAGREVDKPTTNAAVTATEVRSIALFGHHAINPQWGLVYGAGRTRQGSTTREALSAGLRLRF